MIFNKKEGKSALFKKFLFSYCTILFIPLLLATFAYNAAVKVVEENAIESRLTMLRQTKDIVDKHLKEIDDMIIQIAFDPKMNNVLNIDEPEEGSPEIYKLWEYAREIKTHTVTTNVFKSTFFIYLKNSNFVFSHDDTYYDFNKFYNNVLSYESLDFDKWNDVYFKDYSYKRVLPSRNIKINDTNFSAITYLCSLPMVKESKPEGVVAFLIDQQEIKKMLTNQIYNNSGTVFIFDNNGTVITEISHDKNQLKASDIATDSLDGYTHKNINGEDIILIYTHSDYSGWSYTAALPKNTVIKNVLYIRQVAISVALISMILGIIISLFLANRNTKPFREAMLTLKEFFNSYNKIKMENNLNEYDYLKGGISRLITGTIDMEEALTRQSAEMKTVLMDRLLKGEFNDKSRMATLLEHIGFNISGNKFVIITIKINRNNPFINTDILNELEYLRVGFENIIRKNLQDKGYIHLVNEVDIAVLLNFNNESQENIEAYVTDLVKSISSEMDSIYHISPEFGVGDIYDDLFDAHFSYREALHALESIDDSIKPGPAVWYKNVVKDNTSYYYPMDLELKLANLAKAGNWTDIETILEKVYTENYKNRRISNSLEKYLIYNMKATLIKLLGEIHSDADIRNLDNKSDNKNNALSVFNEIKEIYYKICMSVEDTRKSHNSTLTDSIVQFIEENFTDANISVYSIATQFNLSESYFSQFFKEQTGEYFSNYLENLRIKYACKLIREGNLSIDNISLKAGYNSSNSFRRAFKRATGMAPSQYNNSSI